MKSSRMIFFVSFVVAIFGLTIFFTNTSVAASFECKKAASSVEHLICKNPDVSELDSTLGKLYSSLKNDNNSLIGSQRKWLEETRNVCTTVECLKNVYTNRIATLKSHGDCPIGDMSLQGNWKREKIGPFEEMRFDLNNNERVFLSWSHQHLEMTGTWSIDKCIIHIQDKNSPQLEFDLQIKALENNILRIVDLDDNTEGTYRKIK